MQIEIYVDKQGFVYVVMAGKERRLPTAISHTPAFRCFIEYLKRFHLQVVP